MNEYDAEQPPRDGQQGAGQQGAGQQGPGAEDSALERVRAADPALGAEPDLPALRAAVDRRVAEQYDGDERRGGASEHDAAQPDELAARRATRRWVPTSAPARVAAAVAAALVVGGGGYVAGTSVDGAPAGPPAAGVITLGGAGEADGGAPFAGPEIAADTASVGVANDRMFWPGYSGRTVFTASGLSGDGGTAQAWGFDPLQAYDEATLAKVAAALGVEGTPKLNEGYWHVGPQDGTGPALDLNPDGMASVYYYDPTADPWSCVATPAAPEATDEGASGGGSSGSSGSAGSGPAEPAPDVDVAPDPAPDPAPGPDGSTTDGSTTEGSGTEGSAPDDVVSDEERTREMVDPSYGIMPVEPCEQRDIGPAPKGDDAVRQARDLIGTLGWDPASFEVVAEESEDTAWSWVNAHHVVDGQRTGVVWSFAYTGAGLQSFNGALAPLVALGEYQVVSPAEAVERLSDPRFGSGGYPIAYATGATALSAREGMTEVPQTPQPPEAASAGTRIGWPVQQVTIVEARLGAAMHVQPDGATLLVPTYELTGSDGSIWSVIAVVESALDFTAGR